MRRVSQPRRILVVKLADLGDLLLCEPAVRSLRTAFPGAQLDLLVPPTSAALVPVLGHAVNVITFPKQLFDDPRGLRDPRNALLPARLAWRLRRARYDELVILHHLTTPLGARKFRALAAACGAPHVAGLDNGRGAFLTQHVADLGFGARHEAEYMLAVARAAGGAAVDPTPRVVVSAEPPAGLPERYVVVYPATGSFSSARAWPVDKYVKLVQVIMEQGTQVVIVGGDDARLAARAIRDAMPAALDLTGRTTLAQLAAVVGGSEAVVGGDSFIGHLAAALHRPLVAIFGPSNDDAWKPYGAMRDTAGMAGRRLVVRQDLPCAPCLYTGFALGRPAGCPTRTCLTTLPVARVADAVRLVCQEA